LVHKKGKASRMAKVLTLVDEEGQIPVAPNPLRVDGVHDGFRRGADSNGHLEVRLARLGYPGNLPQTKAVRSCSFLKGQG
jgi:hypothetical protein